MAFIEQWREALSATPLWLFVIRVVVATFCGAAIGLERTKRSKEAGIRTHCIIACASALFMVVSQYGFVTLAQMANYETSGVRGADPARIAAQVVSGISFLGAGVIFKNGNTVKGLTTAAGIWATAAVGLACGCGMEPLAIIVTLLIVLIQILMHRFNIGADAWSNAEIRIKMDNTPELRQLLKDKQQELGVEVFNARISVGADGTVEYALSVRLKNPITFEDASAFLENHPGIHSLSV